MCWQGYYERVWILRGKKPCNVSIKHSMKKWQNQFSENLRYANRYYLAKTDRGGFAYFLEMSIYKRRIYIFEFHFWNMQGNKKIAVPQRQRANWLITEGTSMSLQAFPPLWVQNWFLSTTDKVHLKLNCFTHDGLILGSHDKLNIGQPSRSMLTKRNYLKRKSLPKTYFFSPAKLFAYL